MKLTLILLFICIVTNYTKNVNSLDISITENQFIGIDSHDFIQKSLTDIHASGGGTLNIGPGTFIVGRFLNIYSNTRIVGDGIDKTILKLKDF
ncbi:MAG: Pectate lyase superfamily protein, partial [Bacteroidota bacterium]